MPCKTGLVEKRHCLDKSGFGDMKNHLYDIKLKANAEPAKNLPHTALHCNKGRG